MPDSPEVRAVFFYHEKKTAIVSLGIARDRFLQRVRAGESIPIPIAERGIRANLLLIECGADTFYAMTVDHLTDKAGKLYEFSFEPLVRC